MQTAAAVQETIEKFLPPRWTRWRWRGRAGSTTNAPITSLQFHSVCVCVCGSFFLFASLLHRRHRRRVLRFVLANGHNHILFSISAYHQPQKIHLRRLTWRYAKGMLPMSMPMPLLLLLLHGNVASSCFHFELNLISDWLRLGSACICTTGTYPHWKHLIIALMHWWGLFWVIGCYDNIISR